MRSGLDVAALLLRCARRLLRCLEPEDFAQTGDKTQMIQCISGPEQPFLNICTALR